MKDFVFYYILIPFAIIVTIVLLAQEDHSPIIYLLEILAIGALIIFSVKNSKDDGD